jgi:hypothetical protein
VLLPGQLAAKVAVLNNERKFRQHPAYSDDKRIFGALRYRPDFLNRSGNTFEISGNYEHGSIKSNRPRILPPLDQVSAWWAPVSQGGLNKQVYDPYATRIYTDQNAPATFLPPLGGYRSAPIILDPAANTFGFTTPRRYLARRPDGTIIESDDATGGDGPFPQSNSYGRVGVRRYDEWAAAAGLPFASFGGYQPATLTDPTIFDFYNKLMDGPNKGEWTDWDVVDVSLVQTFLNDQVGYQMAAFKQDLDGGHWAALGWQNRLMIDVNTRNLDGTPEPNVGRAFIEEELRDTNATRTFPIVTRGVRRFSVSTTSAIATTASGRVCWVNTVDGQHQRGEPEDGQPLDQGVEHGYALHGALQLPALVGEWRPNVAFRYYLSDDLRSRSSAQGAECFEPGPTVRDGTGRADAGALLRQHLDRRPGG